MSALTSIFAGIAVAIIATGTHGDAQGVESTAPIQVVSDTYEIDFPDEVLFRLEAESTRPITGVTFFYRVARQKVRIYGYPEFNPSTHLTADFRLRTSGASYLPSGVDIEYYYRIEDADGNTATTERSVLEYRDPRYDWQELRQGDLVVIWHDTPSERVREATAEVGRRLDRAVKLIGLEESPPMKAVLVSTPGEAGQVFPLVSETARRGHLYGGFAFGDYDLFVLAGLNADGMVHEATHLLLAEAVDSPLARVPAWLNEGLATHFEGDRGWREGTVESAARRGALLKLRGMNSVPGRPEDVRLFYAQAWSIVKHMIDTYGYERVTALLEALNSGNRIDAAILVVYGVSLEELERQWKGGLLEETTVAQRPDPGTIGTSGIIAAAIVIAMVGSLLHWRMRRAERSEPGGWTSEGRG